MGYALALSLPKTKTLVEKLKEDKESFDSKKLSSYIQKNWWRLPENERNELAIAKLYVNFKNKDFCGVLQTSRRINNSELVEQIKNYVWKRNNPLFNLYEKLKHAFKKSTEYELILSKLKKFVSNSYNSISGLMVKENPKVTKLKRKYLRDLTKDEREEIIIRRMYKEDVDKLVRDFYLLNKEVVYQVVAQYNKERKREHIKRISQLLETNYYDPKDILDLVNKFKKKTFARLSDEEKREISWMNKKGRIRAEELVKIYNLTGRHVVYLANRWVREQKKKKEGCENKADIKLPAIYVQPAGYVYSA